MVDFITFASSKIEKLGRAIGNSVVGIATGNAETGLDAEVYGHHGFVSRPSKATRGVRIRIGSLSIVIAAYTYGVEPPAAEGASKVYGTDAAGVEKCSTTHGADGVIEAKNSLASRKVDAAGKVIDTGTAIELNGNTKVFVTGAELQTVLTGTDSAINGNFSAIATTLGQLITAVNALGYVPPTYPVVTPYVPVPVATTTTPAHTTTVKTGG